MKSIVTALLLVMILVSCKNDSKDTATDADVPVIEKTQEIPLAAGEERFRGDFIYSGDAAVLTTRDEIYAVAIDEKMHELDAASTALKKTEYDMVTVVVHGIKKPNPMRVETGDGWEHMVTITKIIELAPASSMNVIKTGK
jgi:uncharacterized lipoprotein NlpE involved in copper resistance